MRTLIATAGTRRHPLLTDPDGSIVIARQDRLRNTTRRVRSGQG